MVLCISDKNVAYLFKVTSRGKGLVAWCNPLAASPLKAPLLWMHIEICSSTVPVHLNGTWVGHILGQGLLMVSDSKEQSSAYNALIGLYCHPFRPCRLVSHIPCIDKEFCILIAIVVDNCFLCTVCWNTTCCCVELYYLLILLLHSHCPCLSLIPPQCFIFYHLFRMLLFSFPWVDFHLSRTSCSFLSP